MDYVLFEDMKPAGCEPLEQLSGFTFGEGLYAHSELRDTKVAFFIDHMPLGRHALRYRLRAETPGTFHALPTNGYAMYAPDVRALSDSELLTVKDVGP
jgi:alpha-2-macroglobulin